VCANASSASDTFARVKRETLVHSSLRMLRLHNPANVSSHQASSHCLGVCSADDALRLTSDYGTFFKDLSLVVFDDLHLMDAEYEMLIMRVLEGSQRANTRIIGCTASLYDGNDLGEWLRVPDTGRFLFRPTDRSTALTTVVQPFSIPQSPTLMKSMVKPVYAAIKSNLQEGAIVFVPSLKQCRPVAMDLVTRSGMEMDLNGFLPQGDLDMESIASRFITKELIEPLLHGIGMWWAGLHPGDSVRMLQLFASGLLRALIVPRESCWTLKAPPVGAVIVMGAQYVEVQSAGRNSDKRTRNYNLQELVQMQSFAARPRLETVAMRNHVGGATGRFYLLCQAEQQEIYLKFLNEGLPLESSLVATLEDRPFSGDYALKAMLDDVSTWSEDVLRKPRQPTRQDFMDILSWSFLAKRIRSNPIYYDASLGLESERMSRLVDGFLASYFQKRKANQRQVEDGTQHDNTEAIEAADKSHERD
jgi:antiviral helicase SLH1